MKTWQKIVIAEEIAIILVFAAILAWLAGPIQIDFQALASTLFCLAGVALFVVVLGGGMVLLARALTEPDGPPVVETPEFQQRRIGWYMWQRHRAQEWYLSGMPGPNPSPFWTMGMPPGRPQQSPMDWHGHHH